MCLWVSYLLLALHMRAAPLDNPQLALYGLDIPPTARGFFFTGDGIVVASGLVMLFQMHYSGASESMRLRWSSLYLGFIFSIHLPVIIRSLVFQSGDFYKTGETQESNKLMFAILATAFATAVCLVVTTTAAIAVDLTPKLRYNDRMKALSKWTIVVGIVCGETFFIAGIVEYQYMRTVHSSIALLVLSLLLTTAGYVPARFFSECQHYFEEDVPLMR